MEFQVYTDAAGNYDNYTGNVRYELPITGGGVLTAWREDGTKVVYSPTGWLRIEVPPEPQPEPQPTLLQQLAQRPLETAAAEA